ncbi:MAG: hypothetical protein JWN93_256 [Hyphomicrobiales bacterium]|nr:hypothetical protein [Hyphomicrobiales bacterium]
MTLSPAIALRKAMRDRLLANSALLARLGAQRIHDEAPRAAATPYVTFTQAQMRDWSTMTDRGAEHVLNLDVWSSRPGAHEALEIAALVAAALDDAPLALDGHRLVSLRCLDTQTGRENANRFVRARLRFRAVTESL